MSDFKILLEKTYFKQMYVTLGSSGQEHFILLLRGIQLIINALLETCQSPIESPI